MKTSLTYYLKYAVFLMGIQTIFRILFMLAYRHLGQGIDGTEKWMALVHGLKLDLSLTGYCLLIPTLLLFLASFIKRLPIVQILDVYTFMVLLLLIPLFFVNLVIYRFWNFPIDRSIFDYLNTPGEMFASLNPWRMIFILLLVGAVFYLFYFILYRKVISKPFNAEPRIFWGEPIFYFICLPSLIIPIRGGLELAPINSGSVYFHQEAYINHAAVNPVWNLGYTLTESGKLSQFVNFMPDTEAGEIMEGIYDHNLRSDLLLNNPSPNIIVILLESFSSPVTDLEGKDDATPNFDALIREGIYFDRFYASGTMTDRALGAILGGYPGIPGTCIIYYEQKNEKIPNLNMRLKSRGYGSAFLYGGDIDFAHIRSFLVTAGFDRIISDKDFNASVHRSNWGVPDHLMFQRLLEETDKASFPFMHILLTLSSHTPFDIPMEHKFPGNSYELKYLSSIYYTDKALGEFIAEAKSRDWWDESLVILLADHGCRIGNLTEHEEKRFRIPMLWLGGALAVRDTVVHTYGSQTDLPFTLLGQLDLSRDEFKFSNDLLSGNTESFAYYTFHDGIGFISDSTYAVYNLTTDSYIVEEDQRSRKGLKKVLAYLQYLLEDFNNL